MQRQRRRERKQQGSERQAQVDACADLEGEEWIDDDPDDSGEFMVLRAAWDEEFDQVIVYYFDKALAAADGKTRNDLLRCWSQRWLLHVDGFLVSRNQRLCALVRTHSGNVQNTPVKCRGKT